MKPRFSHRRMRGTPFQVHGRVFIPEAQVTTVSGREAMIGAGNLYMRGYHTRRVQPTALIESTPQGEQRYHINDPTMRALTGMLIVALLIPILSIVLGHRLGTG